MPNPFVHIEISSRDVEVAKRFYGSVFGWTYVSTVPGYAVLQSGMKPGRDYGCEGAVMTVPANMPAPSVTPYVQVQDVDAASARILAAGGAILMPKTDVPNAGSFAVFADLDGNVLGVWKSIPKASLRRERKKPGKKRPARKKTTRKPARKKAVGRPVRAKAAKKKPLVRKKVAKKTPRKRAAKKVAKKATRKAVREKMARKPVRKKATRKAVRQKVARKSPVRKKAARKSPVRKKAARRRAVPRRVPRKTRRGGTK